MTLETGLYVCEAGKALHEAHGVPLKAMTATVEVIDFCADVTLFHEYYNDRDESIESVFRFPINEKTAVTGLEVVNGGRSLKGRIERTREAAITYTGAIGDGKTAVLLRQVCDDILECNVGNIAAHSGVTVSITYVTELDTEDDCMRFRLPLTVIPRYTGWLCRGRCRGRCRGCVPVATSDGDEHDTALPFEFRLNFNASTPVREVTSLTHDIEADIGSERMSGSVTMRDSALIDSDLDVLFQSEMVNDGQCEPTAVVERHPRVDSRAVLVSFFPQIEQPQKSAEIILMIDRSGSMRGERIALARRALQIFLRSLPPNCYFNIIGFGSNAKRLFEHSERYSERSLSLATAHVDSIEADYGGTEILEPLKLVTSMKQKEDVDLRSVILLTDGAVQNTREVLNHAYATRQKVRVFTLGIGSGCSRGLVSGLAEKSNGSAEFVIEGEPLNAKVVRQLKRSMSYGLNNIAVDWNGLRFVTANGSKQLFRGDRLLVYGLETEKVTVPTTSTVSIKAVDHLGETVSFEATLSFLEDDVLDGDLIHRLAAKTLVKDAPQNVSEIVSLKYGVASQFCSFVVVDASSNEEVRSRTIRVPTPEPRSHASRERKKRAKGGRGGTMSSPGSTVCRGSKRRCRGSTVRSSPVFKQLERDAMQPLMVSGMDCADDSEEETVSANFYSTPPVPSMSYSRPSAQQSQSIRERESTPFSLDKIVRQQAFCGTWSITFAATLLETSKAAILEKTASVAFTVASASREDVIGTCIVVAFLRKVLRANSADWELVVSKAEKYITAQTSLNGKRLTVLVSKAVGLTA